MLRIISGEEASSPSQSRLPTVDPMTDLQPTYNNDPDQGPFADEKDRNLVDWDSESDPANPKNWSYLRRWIVTISMALMAFCVTFASSVFSAATDQVAKEFHVSSEVTTLGTSLFVLGFSFGPIVWGPFSELFGRKGPLFGGFIVFAIFEVPVAIAQKVETIMLCRFFGGFFGSAPLAVVGGALADLWDPIDRAYAISIFGAGTFIGPVGGPIIGGFITDSFLGWRWTSYINLIMAALFGIIGFFVISETSESRLLQRKATRLRHQTHNWALHAQADEEHVTIESILTRYLLRPFVMIVQEPILMAVTMYMSFIYGILYLFFEAYPIAFQEQRGWNDGVGALPFISIIIGVAFGCLVVAISTKTRFAPNYRRSGQVIPEDRLPPMVVGAVVLPIGLFWFAWTSNPHIIWVPQALAGIPVGMGLFLTFWQGLNYIIDCYKSYVNSAIAINTFVRSLAGAGFPMFAAQMYRNLGVPWATSVLAFLCVLFAPVPVLFLYFGPKLRSWSRFVPDT